jgi:two-component system CheB/CheR fusion protein
MQVLIVEDHTDSRVVLATLLNHCGCRTVTAKNFKEACARLDSMRFDILIADLSLPDGDGLDLVRYAKGSQSLKTIALTARDSEEERRRGVEAGFDYYLTKPVDFLALRQAISSCVD